jgi:hypothetical protein
VNPNELVWIHDPTVQKGMKRLFNVLDKTMPAFAQAIATALVRQSDLSGLDALASISDRLKETDAQKKTKQKDK